MQSICVFAGSNPGRQPEYGQQAAALGRALARRGITVIYGGARIGNMGALADAALAEGGHVVGVIPSVLMEAEIAHTGLTDLRVVDSIHKRKALMAELSDGFIALPGGAGTLEEFAEVFAWLLLGLHSKPTAIYNVLGFYDLLLDFLEHAADERFLRPEHRSSILVESEVETLLTAMEAWAPSPMVKWMDSDGSDLDIRLPIMG